MPTRFGVFRNDGDDGDRNDGDDGDDGDSRAGIPSGGRTNLLLAQALWRTRGEVIAGLPGIGTPVWTDKPLQGTDIGRWSKDVRAHLYSFELLSGLHFEKGKDGGTLWSYDLGGEGGRTLVLQKIKTLKRPAFDYEKEAFDKEMAAVITAHADLRPERMAEILTQVQVPYPFFASVLNLQRGRHRYTYELMSTVFAFSSTVVMQFKNHLKVRRPADRSPLVQPVLPTPGHGSYPAGHATQCHFVAGVLKALVRDKLGNDLEGRLDVLAGCIAHNRVVAGLHYVEDNVAGKELGIELAAYFERRAKAPESALDWLWTRASEEWKNT